MEFNILAVNQSKEAGTVVVLGKYGFKACIEIGYEKLQLDMERNVNRVKTLHFDSAYWTKIVFISQRIFGGLKYLIFDDILYRHFSRITDATSRHNRKSFKSTFFPSIIYTQ